MGVKHRSCARGHARAHGVRARRQDDRNARAEHDPRGADKRYELAASHCPMPSRASDRKDSTPRHGRLLHPSSWAERDDRDHAAENFFQGGSPKISHPTSAPATSLTTKNRFTPNFRGWRLDEFSIFARPPPRGLSLTPGREAFHPMDAAGDQLFA